jgi:hypothetical protein
MRADVVEMSFPSSHSPFAATLFEGSPVLLGVVHGFADSPVALLRHPFGIRHECCGGNLRFRDRVS